MIEIDLVLSEAWYFIHNHVGSNSDSIIEMEVIFQEKKSSSCPLAIDSNQLNSRCEYLKIQNWIESRTVLITKIG